MSTKTVCIVSLVLVTALGSATQAASTPFSVNAIYDAMVANDPTTGPDQSLGGTGLHVRDIPARRRVALVSWDISAIKQEGLSFENVSLELIAADGGTINVYGVSEELDNISGSLTWNAAPGVQNDPAPAVGDPVALDLADLSELLMTFSGIPGGSSTRVASEPSQALADFMNTDTDGIITLLFAPPEGGQAILRSAIRWNNPLAGTFLQGFVGGVSRSATRPLPEDGLGDVYRDSSLSWTAGGSAASHDIYLGTGLDDVNDASRLNPMGVLVSEGQDANSLMPGRLELGATYYWRVDEVNSAPDRTIFKGPVWSFTVEPVSIPVTPVSVTASSAHADTMGPENTIDGSGLNALDQHSTQDTDMWLSGMGDTTPTLQYEFDKAYKLHEMWVWNSNQMIESFIGIGAKDIVVETSVDGESWTVLAGATQLAQAPGAADYTANSIIDLEGAVARYVKITITSGHGISPQQGLSELRFLYIPTYARNPQPEDGAVDVSVDASLTWRAGREAVSHQVALSTDPAAIAEGTAPITDTDSSSLDPQGLDLASTYYWQTTEVNRAETPGAYADAVWSFSTQPYVVVDDFEAYNDDCGRIFFIWEDGFGHNGSEGIEGCTVPPSNGNGSGSIVGNAQAPFAETSTVNSGAQAMPLDYEGASVTTRRFTPAQDWSRAGITTLVIYFYGMPGNTGQLYALINGQKVLYNGDAANLSLPIWSQWNIDLASVDTDLSRVGTLSIGTDGPGAGMILVDDIRLYAEPPALPDELVWVEAESGSVTAPMTVFAEAETPGASGTGFVSCPLGTADAGSAPPYPDGTLTLPFTVEGGVYTIRFRVAFPGGDDSCWIRVPTATIDSAVHSSGWIHFNDIPPSADWHWSQFIKSEDQGGEPPVQFTLDAGTHNIEIAYRGADLKFDAMQIQRIGQ